MQAALLLAPVDISIISVSHFLGLMLYYYNHALECGPEEREGSGQVLFLGPGNGVLC